MDDNILEDWKKCILMYTDSSIHLHLNQILSLMEKAWLQGRIHELEEDKNYHREIIFEDEDEDEDKIGRDGLPTERELNKQEIDKLNNIWWVK